MKDYRKAYSEVYEIVNMIEKVYLDRIPKKSQKTIYIGGGTPCSLSNSNLEILLSNLKPLLKENYEFTIESNPENLTIEKVEILSKYGYGFLTNLT